MMENVCANGDIDSEAYVRAILQFRNTPDSDSGLSPAEVVFGRTLRDILPVPPRSQIFDNNDASNRWADI